MVKYNLMKVMMVEMQLSIFIKKQCLMIGDFFDVIIRGYEVSGQ